MSDTTGAPLRPAASGGSGSGGRPSAVTMVLRQYDYYRTLLRRTWRGSVFSYTVLPVLFLLSMGVGLGGYVRDEAALGGVSYLAYIAPGMLAVNAMQAAVGEAAWPVFGNFKWTKLYYAMTSTPLRVVDVLNAALVYIAARMMLISTLLVVVLALFGTVDGVLGGAAAVLAGTLVGVSHAVPTVAYSAHLESDTGFAPLFRIGIIPMMLFSGAFFPVDQLPVGVQWLSYATPIWHGVELARMCTTGQVAWSAAGGHAAYLLALVAAGWWLASRAFHAKLRDAL